MNDIIQTIEDFLCFGESKLELDPLDKVYARNRIYDVLDVTPTEIPNANKIDDVNYFVEYFKQYFTNKGLDEINLGIKISELFDLISPRPSKVVERFNEINKTSPKDACLYLYNLGINNYYIHKADIDKNVEWKADFNDGPSIEVSINLSKPEKSNKDIAKLLSAAPTTNYPKCVLCLENLGFKGSAKKAPRHNIRMVPLTLNNEEWFMQYSPYGYFKEHLILFLKKHDYMEISPRIFASLFDYVDQFPHYSIVSNSDLPIVGGSILNHEHFQGGNYSFPLQLAKDKFIVEQNKFPHTTLAYLDFYNSAFRLKGKDKKEILSLASLILDKWHKYNDESVDIISSKDGKKQNTITPILRINKNNEYEFILILRNNGTSEKYPDGIFHVHPEYFAIKKEAIGVIEAMGRFILPARLVRQLKEVDDVVNNNLNKEDYLKKYPDLVDFSDMISYMKENHKTGKEYINHVCQNILRNTAVFKKDDKGSASLNKFISSLDLK